MFTWNMLYVKLFCMLLNWFLFEICMKTGCSYPYCCWWHTSIAGWSYFESSNYERVPFHQTLWNRSETMGRKITFGPRCLRFMDKSKLFLFCLKICDIIFVCNLSIHLCDYFVSYIQWLVLPLLNFRFNVLTL